MNTDYPTTELDTGVGHNFRSAYAPVPGQEDAHRRSSRSSTSSTSARGIDLFGKVKYIHETDKRMNDARFLPYQAGRLPGRRHAPAPGDKNFYSAGNSTVDTLRQPVGHHGATASQGYQWKPFDSLSDDDRELNYWMANVGAGYQLHRRPLRIARPTNYYHADLLDGNTAFQAYNLHEMASGTAPQEPAHRPASATRSPGSPSAASSTSTTSAPSSPTSAAASSSSTRDQGIADSLGFPVGSPGFAGRFTGWNSLLDREFDQQRLKAYIKVAF